MKKILGFLCFIVFACTTGLYAQTYPGSNPTVISISGNTIAKGQTGTLEVAVMNSGYDLMPAGTFRTYINIDPTKMEFVDPAADIANADNADWAVVSISSGGVLTLQNTNGEMSSAEVVVFNIRVRALATAPDDEAIVSLRVGISPTQLAVVGNTNILDDNSGPNVVPLPVRLVSFNATKEGVLTSLSWSTTLETNSDRFDVERSGNGKSWSNIGSVASSGESVSLKNYNFTDKAPLSGENLYRLKMVDKDATFAYSSIRSVRFDEPTAYVYPNPSADKVFLNKANLTGVSQVSVLDMNGRAVLTTKSFAQGVDIKGLAQGAYLLKISNIDGSSDSHKFVISH